MGYPILQADTGDGNQGRTHLAFQVKDEDCRGGHAAASTSSSSSLGHLGQVSELRLQVSWAA